MNEPIVGRLIEGDVFPRDALHMAMAAVTAGERLEPGQRVGIIRSEWKSSAATRWEQVFHVARVPHPDKELGIVDPFLRGVVLPGQRFWLWLFPKTITGLQHNWTHTAFDGAQYGS